MSTNYAVVVEKYAERHLIIGKLLKGAPADAEKTLVCGIQGSWGSGKSSLVRMAFISSWGLRIDFASHVYSLICDVIKDTYKIICEAIQEATSYGFAAYLAKAACDPQFRLSLHRQLNFDDSQKRKIEQDIQAKCIDVLCKLSLEKELVFVLDFDDFAGLIAWTPMNDYIRNRIYVDLAKEPKQLFRILDIYLHVSDQGEILFDSANSLRNLDKQLSCSTLLDKVKNEIDISKLDERRKTQYELLENYVNDKQE